MRGRVKGGLIHYGQQCTPGRGAALFRFVLVSFPQQLLSPVLIVLSPIMDEGTGSCILKRGSLDDVMTM